MRLLGLPLAALAVPVFAQVPVRGLHMSAPKPDEVSACLRFIREALPKEGVNLLVLEFGYRYQFTPAARNR